MTIHLIRIKFLSALLFISGLSIGQKNIIISDSLANNAEKLPVKMGSQSFGKIWKFKFGDYAVVSSKLGWTTGSSKSNFWNTKTDSKTTQKFSFNLTNKASDTAKVNAADNIEVQALQSFPLTANFSIGTNELVQESKNFSAFININSDTAETWVLLMNVIRKANAEGNYEAFMTNGERKIFIIPASSNKPGDDHQSMPAQGYEFTENGYPLCAVQYLGSGALGMNKNIVWINAKSDAKMQLILAAAMTALLQLKVTSPSF
ncbi:hypothetical protein [Flavihumibacter profundi]|uniref:hypothetical protein n=1 Tax=Flavihumibacter profundi TaxID=2716883 RepID=UPI001CC3351B|nr:hypothetical protein [Flavihumibacter profundi]MBZ5858344.1 hypothetical protein [Flavihumibacter profundi]